MDNKPLFPVIITGSEQISSVTFPACAGPSLEETDVNGKEKVSQLDWLKNSSFQQDNALTIHKISQIRSTLDAQEVSNDSQPSSDDSEAGKQAEEQVNKRHHSRVSDEETSNEPPTKKYKKKKKKEKHKHKRKHKYKHEDYDFRRKKDSHEDDKLKKKKETPVPVGTPGGRVFQEEMSSLMEVNYRLDHKPDVDNLRFLQLYKMRIARYRRLGHGCLGSDPNELLILEGSSKKDKLKPQPVPRYFVGTKVRKQEAIFIAPIERAGTKGKRSRFDQLEKSSLAFIPIEAHQATEQGQKTVTNPLGVYDSSTERYLEGKPSEVQQRELTQAVPSGEEDGGPSLYDPNSVLSKTAEFNKHLKNHPGNVDKWLEFVDFQDDAVSADMDLALDLAKVDGKKRASRVVLLDIKVSILEQAIKKNPASVRLKMKQLELCADQWESEKLDKEWEKLVFAHPNDPQVWWQRLLHIQSSVELFSVSRVIKVYTKCFNKLTSIRDGIFKSHPPKPHLEEYMLAIFQQLVHVLLQAGHTEKAMALLQATVEVNLFCPDVLSKASRDDKLQFLGSFWDSAMPRSGETGALGFATWIERKGAVPFCTTYSKDGEIAAEDEAVKDAACRCAGWLALESSRSSRHLFAWRPESQSGETEEECEDLERIVMLEELCPCVILFTSELCHIRLITTYLDALGVKVAANILSSDKVVHRAMRSSLDNLSQISPSPRLENKVLYHDSEDLMLQTATNLLLQVQTAKVFSRHQATFVNLALMDIRKQHLGFKLKEGHVCGKEVKTHIKELRKNAKHVLKEPENRNNLLLWEQYVDLEWLLSSPDDARKVLHTALAMKSNPMNVKPGETYESCVTCKLYRHYAELELGLCSASLTLSHEIRTGEIAPSSRKGALYVLVSLAGGDNFVPPVGPDVVTPATRILRARLGFQSTLEQLLMEQGDKATWSHSSVLRTLPQVGTLLAHWAVCYSLFQYLTQGLGASIAVFEQVQTKMKAYLSSPSRSTEKCSVTNDLYMEDDSLYYQTVYEDLMCAKLKLLQRNMSAAVVPMNVLRQPLQHHLRELPDSPLLLNMCINLEVATNIVGRLRRYLHSLTAKCETPLIWIYGTISDIMRREKIKDAQKYLSKSDSDLPEWMLTTLGTVGSQHQLRAWLERAINHTAGRFTILLWRLYFHFEVGEGEMSKAKSVYYRGIAQCPAAKALCMDFARAFPDHLEEVTDFMLEKELRLRVPLEEVDILLPDYKPKPVSKQWQSENPTDAGLVAEHFMSGTMYADRDSKADTLDDDGEQGSRTGSLAGDGEQGSRTGSLAGDEEQGSRTGSLAGDEEQGSRTGSLAGDEEQGSRIGSLAGDGEQGSRTGSLAGDEEQGSRTGILAGDGEQGSRTGSLAGDEEQGSRTGSLAGDGEQGSSTESITYN